MWEIKRKDGQRASKVSGWNIASKDDAFVIKQKTTKAAQAEKPSMFVIGLGWDPVTKGRALDLDAALVLLNDEGRMQNYGDMVYFGNLMHSSGCAHHTGDNLNGKSDNSKDERGDKEQILLWPAHIPAHVHEIVVVVNIYLGISRGQHLWEVSNCYVRLFVPQSEADTEKVHTKLLRFDLADLASADESATTAEFCRFTRAKDGSDAWEFHASPKLLRVNVLGDYLVSQGMIDDYKPETPATAAPGIAQVVSGIAEAAEECVIL